MDDLTKIKGIGKSTAAKLAGAGFDTYSLLAQAGTAENLRKLQDAGFATVDIDRWAQEAVGMTGDAADSGGDHGATGDKAPGPNGRKIGRLIAAQEVRHLGVTYAPGAYLSDIVDDDEARFLLARGSATR